MDDINDSEVRPLVELDILHVIIFFENEADTPFFSNFFILIFGCEIYAVNVVTFLIKCGSLGNYQGLEQRTDPSNKRA